MDHTDNTKNKQSLKKQALIKLALLSKNDNKEKEEGRERARNRGGKEDGRREREKKTYNSEQIKH